MKTVPYPKLARGIKVELPQPYTIEDEARVFLWLATWATGDILEIGCANGYLTKALATANPERTVYAIDWSSNPGLSVHQEAERPDIVASRAIHLPNVVAINGDAKIIRYPPGLGLIIVDGDHTEPGCIIDTKKALDYAIKTGAIVAWHDYRPEAQWQGVARCLDLLAHEGVSLVQVEDTPIVVYGWPCA